jgi:NitT/TauT family transport system permease protein
MVAVGTFWPVAVNARNSTRQVQTNLVWSAKMMGTSDRRLLWRVIIPAALPGIITGFQIAMPLSLIITFVFEMVAGGGGLGALEIAGVRSFESEQVYAAIIAIMLIGIALDRGLRAIRSRLLHWT